MQILSAFHQAPEHHFPQIRDCFIVGGVYNKFLRPLEIQDLDAELASLSAASALTTLVLHALGMGKRFSFLLADAYVTSGSWIDGV